MPPYREYNRRSIRLAGYDYSQAGVYFVTSCVQHRLPLFGSIQGGEMHLNAAGTMIVHWWQELAVAFPTIERDAFVVMPDHIHGIVVLGGKDVALAKVMSWFKTMTTNAYIRGVKTQDWESFEGKLWQRNYYDRIIRNDRELNAIREYVIANPQRWEADAIQPDDPHADLPFVLD